MPYTANVFNTHTEGQIKSNQINPAAVQYKI